MLKIRTTDISPAQSSRSLSNFMGKLNSRPETMEHTCCECLQHGYIILRPATKITNHNDDKIMKQLYICTIIGSSGRDCVYIILFQL